MTVDALPVDASHPDALDIGRIGVEVLLLEADGSGEQVLLREQGRAIRLNVRSGTLASGPVCLRYAIEGFARLDAQLLTIRRLVALWRLGRMPADLFPPERRAARWAMLLRTLDALEDGAAQREIAEVLFGVEAVRRDWRGDTDYLRMRVQRLARSGRELVGGGYLRLLGRDRVTRDPRDR